MDKYEYRVKTEQMLEHVEHKRYKKAMDIADTIDWRRVKNPSMLNSVSEIYENNGEYKKSRDVLFLAYDRAPESRKTVYRLGTLALKTGEIEEASDCYEEFVKLAPKDPNQYILKYKILKARQAPLSEQIEALEEFKKSEYIEKWAYELAKLYDQAGMTAECLEECDDLILWFSEGKYVYQAMELKMKYKPLTPLQQDKYDNRPGAVQEDVLAEAAEPEEAEAEEEVQDAEVIEEPAAEEPKAEPVKEEVRPKEEHKKRRFGFRRRDVKGETLEEAVKKGIAVAAGVEPEVEETIEEVEAVIEEVPEEVPASEIPEEKAEPSPEPKAIDKKDEELRITGQMKIEDILQAWEAKQKENAEAIEVQKQKDDEVIAQKKLEAEKRREEEARRIEEQQRAAEEARKIAEQKAADEARKMAARKAEEERLLAEKKAEEERRQAIEKAEEEQKELERKAADKALEATQNMPVVTDADMADEEEYEEEILEKIEDIEEEDSKEFDEDEFEEAEIIEEPDEETVQEVQESEVSNFFDEEEDEDDIKSVEEEKPVFGDSMTEDLKALMDDLQEEEEELDPDDFFDDDDDEYDESELEEEDFEEETEEALDDDAFEDENEEEEDLESKLAKVDDLTIEEPSEEEIQKRIKKGKGGVPFDTGFVVTGRYDLSATSEIGLRAGLTEEQKKLFSYFVPVRGMSEQIVEVLDNDRREKREGTSRTGNIVVIGHKGSGKTVLAVDIVKAIQKQRNLKQGKVAIVTGESLNTKELSGVVQKLRGGAIIIEKAGQLNARTVKELNRLMEKKTGELLVVLEDQRKPLERLFTANKSFKKKFTSRLELPVFINDELVTFGQTYAKENGYKLDEMGILALYSRIDIMQREDHAVTVAEVKEMMDEAIEHSQKANVKHFARRVFGKGTDDSDRIILKEDDFRI